MVCAPATVTDTSTGPHTEKPAMWLDANTHAGEVNFSSAFCPSLFYADLTRSGSARHRSRVTHLGSPPSRRTNLACPQVTGCTAVLDFTNTVLTGYAAEDEAMVRLLETVRDFALTFCPFLLIS